MIRTIVFSIQYDGSNFNGWQSQINKRTVQGEFEKALKNLFGENLKAIISGRTDTGVHAHNQVISVRISQEIANKIRVPKEKLSKVMNNYLPTDIMVNKSNYLDYDFNARFDAVAREYSYYITNVNNVFDYKYKYQINRFDLPQNYKLFKPLDLNLLNQVSEIFVGNHDFTTFSKVNNDIGHYRCYVEFSYWEKIDEMNYVYRVKANRFVYSMVRTLVGNILYFNTKNCNLNIIDLKENLKAMDRSLSFGIAPSNGLYFEKVYYPEKFKLFD